jgi:Flp pilus assembly pilin Flp
MTQFLRRLWSEERGQNLPEYALLLFLVCLTAVSAMGSMATKVDNIYTNVSTHVTAAGKPALAGGSRVVAAEPRANTQTESKGAKKLKPVH